MFVNQVPSQQINSVNKFRKVQNTQAQIPEQMPSDEVQTPAFMGKFSAAKKVAASDTFVKNTNESGNTFLSKLRGNITAKMLAAIMALSAGATVFTSCEDEPDNINMSQYQTQTVDVNVDLSALTDTLFPLLQTIVQNQQRGLENDATTIAALNAIKEYFKENNIDNKAIIALLQAQGLQFDEIISLIKHIDDDNHTLLNAVTNGFSQTTDAIVALGDKLGNISKQMKAIFNRMLTYLRSIDKTTSHMDGDLHNIDTNVAAILEKLLSGEMSQQEIDFWLELFNRMDQQEQLQSQMWNNLFANMTAMDANRQAEATQYIEWLTNIYNKMDSLKTDPQQVDLTPIIPLLTSINNNTSLTNSLLTTSNDRLAVIKTSLEGVFGYVQHMDSDLHNNLPEFKTLLKRILNKIPDGCECSPTDLTQVINLLQQLLTALKNGDTNEGVIIVGEIEEILG